MLDFHRNFRNLHVYFYFYTLISVNWLKTTIVEQVNIELPPGPSPSTHACHI